MLMELAMHVWDLYLNRRYESRRQMYMWKVLSSEVSEVASVC